jgi:integrase/recombinase XerC/integrase/recombinase XerD
MAVKAARPSTIQTYHRHLRAFLNFCVDEGTLNQSPLRNVKPPRVPVEQIQPFSPEQVQALLNATARSEEKNRNRAILLLLVDSGMRVSEMCSLRVSDVDRTTGQIVVVGKGNKRRTVYTGATSRRALGRYLQVQRPNATPEEALLHGDGDAGAGVGLTPNGVRLMMRRLGKNAGLTGVRVSPHTARHTFAVNFLRGGGNLFELQALMGHKSLAVLRRYVALAQTDLEQAHRRASPADRLRLH